jgi:hypothetical protein
MEGTDGYPSDVVTVRIGIASVDTSVAVEAFDVDTVPVHARSFLHLLEHANLSGVPWLAENGVTIQVGSTSPASGSGPGTGRPDAEPEVEVTVAVRGVRQVRDATWWAAVTRDETLVVGEELGPFRRVPAATLTAVRTLTAPDAALSEAQRSLLRACATVRSRDQSLTALGPLHVVHRTVLLGGVPATATRWCSPRPAGAVAGPVAPFDAVEISHRLDSRAVASFLLPVLTSAIRRSGMHPELPAPWLEEKAIRHFRSDPRSHGGGRS